jgi:hypothetical protein
MKFDESGFSIGNDDGGSYMRLTKDGLELHGEEFVKFTSKEGVSLQGKEVTIEGTKDASVRSNHLRLSGTQLTSIKGVQIELEAMYNVQLKGIHIGFQAAAKLTEVTPLKQQMISGMHVKTCGVYAEQSSLHAIKTGTFALGAGTIGMDGNIISNAGLGKSVSSSTYSSGQASATALQSGLAVAGTVLLTKEPGVSAANQVLTNSMAGAAKPAQEPTGNVSKAKDKKDKQSMNSVAATRFTKTNSLMEKFSIVPNLVTMSRTALMGIQKA